jgi:integrase
MAAATILDPHFDRKLEVVTAGLAKEFCSKLQNKISREDASTIMDYMISLNSEVNPSVNYRKGIIRCLTKFCRYKQLFCPKERANLKHVDRKDKRKEKSIYKPTDMWTPQDDLLFLKYCPSKRMKCFHMMAKDTSCRPHELLKLRIKDVNFKVTSEKYQYAELLVNGKTGSRSLVLIDSIPYLKDYLDHEHPQPGNPNAILMFSKNVAICYSVRLSDKYEYLIHNA